MLEQAKALAPGRSQRVCRDGTIVEAEEIIGHRKKVDKKEATCNNSAPLSGFKVSASFFKCSVQFNVILN